MSILKGIFDENGILEKLLSDYRPQFASHEFKEFSNKYGFEHITTSPHLPHSNGLMTCVMICHKSFKWVMKPVTCSHKKPRDHVRAPVGCQ